MIEQLKNRLDQGETVRFKVKIVPGSSRTSLAGDLGPETIKIRIAAPPEKGKANKELINFLAKTLAIPRNNVTIISGHTSPHKVLEITP